MTKPCRSTWPWFFSISSSRLLGRTFPLKKLRWALDVKGGVAGFGGKKKPWNWRIKMMVWKVRSSWWHCLHFLETNLGGGFKYFYFHPYLGKWSNLTNIFQMGWDHQLANTLLKFNCSPPWKATETQFRKGLCVFQSHHFFKGELLNIGGCFFAPENRPSPNR